MYTILHNNLLLEWYSKIHGVYGDNVYAILVITKEADIGVSADIAGLAITCTDTFVPVNCKENKSQYQKECSIDYKNQH